MQVEIRNLIAEIIELEPDEIKDEAHLVEDLGMDSMMALEILASIEKRFKIQIPEEELPNIVSVNNAVAIAEKYAS